MGRLGFTTNNTKTGMGGCSGICWDPGPGPAHPRDRNRDRDKNLQDSPGTEIPRDNKSRLSRGTRVPICPGAFCVPLDRDRSLRDEREREKFLRDCHAWLFRGTSGTGTKNRRTVLSRPLPIPVLYCDIFYRSIYLLESVIKDCDYIIRSNCTWLFLSRANRDKKSGPLRSHFDLKRKNKNSISYVNWKWEKLCLTFLENGNTYETPTLSLYRSLFQTIIIF